MSYYKGSFNYRGSLQIVAGTVQINPRHRRLDDGNGQGDFILPMTFQKVFEIGIFYWR